MQLFFYISEEIDGKLPQQRIFLANLEAVTVPRVDDTRSLRAKAVKHIKPNTEPMMESKIPITKWNEDDRPREKLLIKGSGALSDAELLAILIGSGSREENAVELARRILRYVDNDLNRLGKCSIAELINNFKGVGEAKAVSILAAAEFGLRRKAVPADRHNIIRSGIDVYRQFSHIPASLPHEEFWILLLNNANRVIVKKKIGQGGVSYAPADIRLILKEVVVSLASGIVLCHNHPSGNLVPSEEDNRLTHKIANLAAELGARLVDHLIVNETDWFSYADNGCLPSV